MTHTKKQADELLRKHARPRVPFTRETAKSPSTMEDVLRRKAEAHRKIQDSRMEDERKCRELRIQQRRDLGVAEEELKRRLKLQSKHGDRVRASVRNRITGQRIVRENDENTRRIGELRSLIKKLERVLI